MKSKLIGQIVSAIGVFCSIISLLAFSKTPIWVKIIIVVVAIFCLSAMLILGIKNNMKNSIICDSEEKIKVEMKKMLQEQGKIVVMSRSLGWVDDEILVATGRKKDRLIVYAEKENDITKKLKDQGVTVRLYGRTGFIPKTRYTIIRYGRNDASILPVLLSLPCVTSYVFSYTSNCRLDGANGPSDGNSGTTRIVLPCVLPSSGMINCTEPFACTGIYPPA